MSTLLPFLTAYDPSGSSEGTLDPMGLYQLADQLAVQLVPAVRERMQRIRFLTGMAVGALVTEDIPLDPAQHDSEPYLVWEWLVVESMMRQRSDIDLMGVPGMLVTSRALSRTGYVDARGYLKTPRIFGFHGVYKRLAVQVGVVDVHLRRGPAAEPLADAWARGRGLGGLRGARQLLTSWSAAVRRSLKETPARTNPGWASVTWSELASAFDPAGARAAERRFLSEQLVGETARFAALPVIWNQLAAFREDEFSEERLHDRIEQVAPSLAPLLHAIRTYERFARALQDGFDLLRADASQSDAAAYDVRRIARDGEFRKMTRDLHALFGSALTGLKESSPGSSQLPNFFAERFRPYGEISDPEEAALAICDHHEKIQREKSAAGKRPWFDRVGPHNIFIRQAYRIARPETKPGRYVHGYRGWPIRRFWRDVA